MLHIAFERKPCDCTLSGCFLDFLLNTLPLVMLFVHYRRMIHEEAVLIPSNTCEQSDQADSRSERLLLQQKKKKIGKKRNPPNKSPFLFKYGLVNNLPHFCVHFKFFCICCIYYGLFLLLLLFYHKKEM